MAKSWESSTEFINLGFSEREAVRLRALLSESPDRLAKAVCRLIDQQFRERERERRPRRGLPHGYDRRVLRRHGDDGIAVANIVRGREPVYELWGIPRRWRRASLESLTHGEFYMYQPCDEAHSFVLNGTRYEMRMSLPPHTYRYEAASAN